MEDYDAYIVFLLGADNFEISKFIRTLADENGMDGIFENCIYIARKFEHWDKDKYDEMGQYESLEHFLKEYDTQIRKYLEHGIEFNVKEKERKQVFVVSLEMFDGESDFATSEVFNKREDAIKYFKDLKAEYSEFWSSFDTIDEENYYLNAFDDGFYANANINIRIETKEIK